MHVDIEVSSACNMKCPMFYTTTDAFKSSVSRQLMDFALFQRLVDECAQRGAFSIRLSLRGEPFLHRQIVSMIRYAKQQGIKEVSTLTNNLLLTPELFREVMEAGLDWLTISFDGLGKTYEEIRKPAIFEDSYLKIQAYHRIKKDAHSNKPVIKMQSVWPAIKNNPRAYFDAFDPYVDDIAINPLVDYLRRDTDITYVDRFVCPVLYQRLSVGADGKVLLCSNDELGDHLLGDATRESLHSIWHGEKLAQARSAHEAHRGVETLPPCKHCYLPRATEPVMESFGGSLVTIDKYTNRIDQVGS
jgi:hypothetical protein